MDHQTPAAIIVQVARRNAPYVSIMLLEMSQLTDKMFSPNVNFKSVQPLNVQSLKWHAFNVQESKHFSFAERCLNLCVSHSSGTLST